jgi:hypothetical protein
MGKIYSKRLLFVNSKHLAGPLLGLPVVVLLFFSCLGLRTVWKIPDNPSHNNDLEA